MIVQVEYSTPVMAVVDTETGVVVRTVVMDDQLIPSGRFYSETGDLLMQSSTTAQAFKIAESADWPIWNHDY